MLTNITGTLTHQETDWLLRFRESTLGQSSPTGYSIDSATFKAIRESSSAWKQSGSEIIRTLSIAEILQILTHYALSIGYGPGAANQGGAEGNLRPQSLMNELAQSDVKYNPNDVVMVTKNHTGKLMWLENGNSSSGLQHILDGHATDLSAKGISNIPQALCEMLQTSPIGIGNTTSGPYADYLYNGNQYRVPYGTNGYIVSFYPK